MIRQVLTLPGLMNIRYCLRLKASYMDIVLALRISKRIDYKVVFHINTLEFKVVFSPSTVYLWKIGIAPRSSELSYNLPERMQIYRKYGKRGFDAVKTFFIGDGCSETVADYHTGNGCTICIGGIAVDTFSRQYHQLQSWVHENAGRATKSIRIIFLIFIWVVNENFDVKLISQRCLIFANYKQNQKIKMPNQSVGHFHIYV